MSELALGLYLAGCLLLVGSGIAKLRRSRGALEAVRRLWADAPAPVGTAIGAAELAVGATGILVGGLGAWLVAALYVCLASFSAGALRGGDRVPCGCFGERSAPIHGVHVVLNLAFAAAALAMAASTPSSAWLLADGGFSSVLVWTLGAVCAWLAYIAMTAWVEVVDAMRQGRG